MATPREIRWLRGELPRWVEQELVTSEQAEVLAAHYGERDSSRWVVALFGVLGAALIGGGIALLVAHNWEHLSRFDRALLCLGMLLGAQAVTAFTAFKRMSSAAWREGAVVATALTIAASIALIGQTYHLPGDGRAFLSTCMLLVLPLVYLFEARVAAGLYLAAVIFWPGVERMNAGDHALLIGALALIAPYLVKLRRLQEPSVLLTSLGGSTVIALGVVVMTVVSDVVPEVSGFVWAALATSLYLAGSDEGGRSEIPGYAGAARTIGSIAMAGGVVALCVVDAWGVFDEAGSSRTSLVDELAYGVVVVAVVGVWLWRGVRFCGPTHRRLASALPVVVLLGIGLQAALDTSTPSVLMMSAYGLALGILALVAGIQGSAIRTANSGLALVVAVVAVRFADSDWSFIARGLGFIALGCAFLALNTRLLRSRREAGA